MLARASAWIDIHRGCIYFQEGGDSGKRGGGASSTPGAGSPYHKRWKSAHLKSVGSRLRIKIVVGLWITSYGL